jgi:hypothetical protein
MSSFSLYMKNISSDELFPNEQLQNVIETYDLFSDDTISLLEKGLLHHRSTKQHIYYGPHDYGFYIYTENIIDNVYNPKHLYINNFKSYKKTSNNPSHKKTSINPSYNKINIYRPIYNIPTTYLKIYPSFYQKIIMKICILCILSGISIYIILKF